MFFALDRRMAFSSWIVGKVCEEETKRSPVSNGGGSEKMLLERGIEDRGIRYRKSEPDSNTITPSRTTADLLTIC